MNMNESKTLSSMSEVIANRVKDANIDLFQSALMECARVQKLVDDANAVMKERKGAISETLFNLARTECDNDVQEFLTRCAKAEEAYKAGKEGRKIPTGWTQAKSNIKVAMTLDMDLLQFETESAMRKALIERRKADKAKAEAEKKESIIDDKESLDEADLYGAMLTKAIKAYDADAQRKDVALDLARQALEMIAHLADMPCEKTVKDGAIDGEYRKVATH